mmetsp:Transcript_9720/g.11200  ORF Transcript_9720/g.11200 Transcript_9720/m.11200 type:complete len:434 (-) Transcript_9720:167-1468(-)
MAEEESLNLEAEAQQEELELEQAKELKNEANAEVEEATGRESVQSKFSQKIGAGKEICQACGKTVYAAEKMTLDDTILHKACFKCAKCKQKLRLGDFAAINQGLYCKAHYLELFAQAGGSYEVFGDAGFEKKTGRSSKVGTVDGEAADSWTPPEVTPREKKETPKSEAPKVVLKKVPPKEDKPAPSASVTPEETTTSSSEESQLSSAVLEKFTKINKSSTADQLLFFQKRYLFTFQQDGVKIVADLHNDFVKACKDAGRDGTFVVGIDFSQFINMIEKKYNKNFTSKKQRDAIFKELDMDGNGEVTFLEYLLHHFKPMMLQEYFTRIGDNAPSKLESVVGRINKRKVVDILIEELFEVPAGADKDLDAAMGDMIKRNITRNERIMNLKDKLKTVGKVKGIGLQKELVQLEKEAQEEKEDVHVSAGIRRLNKKT